MVGHLQPRSREAQVEATRAQTSLGGLAGNVPREAWIVSVTYERNPARKSLMRMIRSLEQPVSYLTSEPRSLRFI